MEKLVTPQALRTYYAGKKVFITGHTGFKGSWLMAWLKQLGATVKGYALEPENSKCLFNILQPLQLGESIIADIRNKEVLREAIISFQPDFIFHLAAQPLVRRSYLIPAETFDVNVTGTANLLEALDMLGKKCTAVIVTTDKVYENTEEDVLFIESDALGGYDPYSASKACAEIVVNSFRNSFFNLSKWEQHRKGVASARAGNVIGGGDYSEDRIVPDVVKALENQQVIEVRNPGSVRPWQHVLEPLGGYLLLGGLLDEAPLKYSGAYNFGPQPGDHLTVKDLVEQSIKSWGKGAWKDTGNKEQLHEATLLQLNIGKAMKELDWTPKLNAAKAIDWTINWYKTVDNAGEFTIQQINDYMRL